MKVFSTTKRYLSTLNRASLFLPLLWCLLACSTSLGAQNLPCNTPTTMGRPTYPVQIENKHTGISGLALGVLLGADKVIDSDPNTAATISIPISLWGGTGHVAVKYPNNPCPAGTFAGFDVSSSILACAQLLPSTTLRTYLNGQLQEERTNFGILLSVPLTPYSRQTMGFQTTKAFDEIQISLNQGFGVTLGIINVYRAVFTKFCAGPTPVCDVNTPWVAPTYPVFLNGERTGIQGLVCALCQIIEADNVVGDTTKPAVVLLPVAIGAKASLSVKNGLGEVCDAGTFAGYEVAGATVSCAVLAQGTQISTYLNGQLQESKTDYGLFITVLALKLKGTMGFVTTKPFDEIRVSFVQGLGVNVGGSLAYHPVIRKECTPSLAVSDVTVNENAGTAQVQICTDRKSTSPITVSYRTVAGSASASSDYSTIVSRTATIPAGQLCTTVTIPITDDNIQEPTEQFLVVISNAVGASIIDPDGSVTILDNDQPGQSLPTVVLSDVTVNEDAGFADVKICLNKPSSTPVTLNYTTNNGTAQVGSDFTTTSGNAIIPAGDTCIMVRVPITDDTVLEPTERFTVTVSNPGGATISDPSGTVTILDNDQVKPKIVISDVTVNENAGTAQVQLCMDRTSSEPVTVNYVTNNNSAQFGSDYTFTSGTATIPAGVNCAVIVVPITDDLIQEPTEDLTITLVTPNGADIADPTGKITILDNDGGNPNNAPNIIVNDVTVNENQGTAQVQICMDRTSTSPVTVNYMTSNASAQFGIDYTFASGTATIPAGQTCTTVIVPILDDNVEEPTETLTITLTNPNGGTIVDQTGTVTILDNDMPTDLPNLMISDVTVNENAGTAQLQVCADRTSTSPMTFNYVTTNASAQFGSDYTFTSGTVTIPAGQSCVTVTVPVIDDAVGEPTETLNLELRNPTGALIADPAGQITILDNDGNTNPNTPNLVINDITVNENAGTATLQVCVSQTTTTAVSVNYTTANTSALAGSDYTALNGTITIPAGQTCSTITIPILDDNTNEPTELFVVNLSNANGATITDPQGTVTILDNDSQGGGNPDCSAIQVTQSNSTISVSGVSGPITSIQIFDMNNNWTTVYNELFYTNQGTVNISTLPAGRYAYKVTYFTAQWTEICKKEGTIITSGGGGNPTPPSITINDVTVNENAGTATLRACISQATTSAVSVNYTTANTSALAGSDYTALNGTITIPAGQTCATVTVSILDDTTNEPTESFVVNLTNPQNATIADPQGTVTILDNDSQGGGNPDCSAIQVTQSNSTISVSGVSGPITSIQIFDMNNNWTTVYNELFYTNQGTVNISTLPAGRYAYKVTYFTAQWTEICKKEGTIITSGGGGNPTPPSITINDVTVNENAGTATLRACISQATTSAVSVNYTTANTSALAGSDYTALNGTITIPAGQTCATVTVSILDDTTNEPTESFVVNLTNPQNATIADPQGTVTILDNDSSNPGDPCSAVTITPDCNTITVSGLSTAVVMVQVFNSSWTSVYNYANIPNAATQTVPNLPAGAYYVKVTLLNASWSTICTKEGYYNVTTCGGGGTCNNVTSAGTISGDQTVCLGAAPATLSSVSLPSGGSGAMEYMWVYSTTGCPTPGDANTKVVSGANGSTFSPGALTQTTWFTRCARRAGCPTFLLQGESNCVKVTVDQSCGSGSNPCSAVQIIPGTGQILVNGLNAPVVLIQAFDGKWSKIYECTNNECNKPANTIPGLAPGKYFVKVDLLDASWLPICKVEGFYDVVSASIAQADLNLTVSKNGEQADLKWLTTTTADQSHFEVERSADAIDFNKVSSVKAEGDVESIQYYLDTDATPLEGMNYYRIKTVNLDGTSSYSNVAKVEFISTVGVSVYPNPAKDKLFVAVESDEMISLQLFNQFGRLVAEKDNAGTQTVEMDIRAMDSGMYFLRVTAGNERSIVQKVIIENLR